MSSIATTMEAAETILPPTVSTPFWRPWMLRVMRRVFVLSWCVTVFCSSYKLNTAYNDFPIFFHPDEGTKGSQVIDDFRNFNHPLLLLEGTKWLVDWKKVPLEHSTVVRTGREVSAILGATAAVGFTLAGYFAAGLPGLLLASLAVGLCPSLIVYSHYMKEDAALVSGIGVTVAGMAWMWNRRGLVAQLAGPVLAGFGVGMAASGKYVGAMAIAGALAAVLLAPRRRWHWIPLRVFLMLLAVLATAAFINERAIDNWDDFVAGLSNEYEHGTTEHAGVTLPKNSPFIYEVVRKETPPFMHGCVIALGVAVVTLRRGWGGDSIMILFAVTCLWVLSQGAIPFHRYGLPVVLIVHFLAALGVARWIMQFRRWPKVLVPAAVVGVAIFGYLQAARAQDTMNQFASDSRVRVAGWADANLPSGSRVVYDSYTLLHRLSHRSYETGNSLFYGPQFGSIDDLRRRRYYTVIVCSSNYERYYARGAVATPGREDEFNYRKGWYDQLFREGKVIWQAKADHPTYSFTNPDITVFSIKQ